MNLCRRIHCIAMSAMLAVSSVWVSSVFADDLRDAVPVDAYLAVWGTKNPERDYMQEPQQAVFNEIEKSKIFEKALHILQSHLSDGDAQQFLTIKSALQNAIAPVEWNKLRDTKEIMYAQKMEGPTALHLVMVRIPDGGAESLRQAIENLMTLASAATDGKLPMVMENVSGVEMKYLQMPAEVPITFQPAIGVQGDVFVFTTSLKFAQTGLDLLANPSAESKFDDPRVVAALQKLPAPEDALVFLDGKQMFQQLHEIPDFITRMSQGQPDVDRISGLLKELINQCSVIDHEISVQYTEGFQQRTATFGQLTENLRDKVVGRMAADQKPFENWTSFVPETAVGFSINDGCNLLPIYDWLMTEIPARFPETIPALDQFAAFQNQHDVHLREDILQAFSGEFVSISLPGPVTMFGKQSDTVLMLRCSQPDHVEELIHRGINALAEIPAVAQQGLSMKDVPGLDGFQQLDSSAFAMAQIAPVIGFHDGWMIVASKASAVKSVFATKSGDAASWADGDRFKEFGLVIKGPVQSISFTNTGENIRAMSQTMQMLGTMAPLMLGAAQAEAGEDAVNAIQIAQEVLGLLPSVGRIIGKLDFYDATMGVCESGPEPNSYIRNTVTLIAPPVPPQVDGATEQK